MMSLGSLVIPLKAFLVALRARWWVLSSGMSERRQQVAVTSELSPSSCSPVLRYIVIRCEDENSQYVPRWMPITLSRRLAAVQYTRRGRSPRLPFYEHVRWKAGQSRTRLHEAFPHVVLKEA